VKIGLIADVHANLQALQAVLHDLRCDGVDFILCAGDLVTYGANPQETIALLRAHGIPSVRGNYDHAVALGHETASRTLSSERTEPLKCAAICWTNQHLEPRDKWFLNGLPWRMDFVFDSLHVAVLHAGIEYLDAWYDSKDLEKLALLVSRVDADVLVLGHTHEAFSCQISSRIIVNPGAVGRSIDGDTRASYAVLDTESLEVSHRRIEYNIHDAIFAIQQSGMPLDIARMVGRGVRRIEDLDTVETSRTFSLRMRT
jgi:putative phosphoesterase